MILSREAPTAVGRGGETVIAAVAIEAWLML
jgi:hypothetical protein